MSQRQSLTQLYTVKAIHMFLACMIQSLFVKLTSTPLRNHLIFSTYCNEYHHLKMNNFKNIHLNHRCCFILEQPSSHLVIPGSVYVAVSSKVNLFFLFFIWALRRIFLNQPTPCDHFASSNIYICIFLILRFDSQILFFWYSICLPDFF